VGNKRRILQRKYWALVIGSPRRPKGLISAPLGKVRMSLMLNTINQKPLVFFNNILKIFVL
jgi:23S rRNA-/tRNA-specific pseudouridylate synthase